MVEYSVIILGVVVIMIEAYKRLSCCKMVEGIICRCGLWTKVKRVELVEERKLDYQ